MRWIKLLILIGAVIALARLRPHHDVPGDAPVCSDDGAIQKFCDAITSGACGPFDCTKPAGCSSTSGMFMCPCKDPNNACVLSGTTPQGYGSYSCKPKVVDMAKPPADLTPVEQTPTCVPPGMVTCPTGFDFVASPTASGCYLPTEGPPNPIANPVDNVQGTCASVGDNTVQCNPNCSFCLKAQAAIPLGCTKL